MQERTTFIGCFLTATIQSRRNGEAFGGLAFQTKFQTPQIETWNTIYQLRFCQFLEFQAPPHKPEAPPEETQSPPIENFLATVLQPTELLIFIGIICILYLQPFFSKDCNCVIVVLVHSLDQCRIKEARVP